MRLVITCEHRFERLVDGTVWTADVFPYAFWQPYLDEVLRRHGLPPSQAILGTGGTFPTFHAQSA